MTAVIAGGLRWHYGPTVECPDPGRMWCYDCRGEVFTGDDGWVCLGCGRSEDVPEDDDVTDDPTPDADEQARLAAEVERRTATDPAAHTPVRAGEALAGLVDRLRAKAATVKPGEAEVDEPIDVLQARVRERAWRNALITAHHDSYIDFTVDKLADDQQPEVMRRYVQALTEPDSPIRTLILTGPIGTGKTAAAIAVGNAATEAGVFVRFVKHSTYLAWLRPDGAPAGTTAVQVRERHRTTPLLILDDLGAEIEREASDFVRSETNDLLGDRLAAGMPTVVTTNLTSTQLGMVLGERLVSRLGAKALPVKFVGPDRRKPVTW